jgi:cellulase
MYADDQMIANNNTWSVKIPTTIKPGNYVLRHETIALHQAQGVGGAQNYPQCMNLMISSDGTDAPAGVLGTELYKDTDPGVRSSKLINWSTLTSC